jgi:hypothetical protein
VSEPDSGNLAELTVGQRAELEAEDDEREERRRLVRQIAFAVILVGLLVVRIVFVAN